MNIDWFTFSHFIDKKNLRIKLSANENEFQSQLKKYPKLVREFNSIINQGLAI